jgi:hypothetical protein
MLGDPAQCREKAKDCQAIADATSSATTKVLFENLAETWLRIANDNERAKALLANLAANPQP